MPQMAPMWWTMIMMSTLMLMMMSIIINYFIYKKAVKLNYNFTKKMVTWKW